MVDGNFSIGGYFELEKSKQHNCKWIPENALLLHSGRGCLRFLISQFSLRGIHLPYYSCDSLAQPFIECNIPIKWYSIDENLEPLVSDQSSDFPLVYINYFGLKHQRTARIAGRHTWIDNTQAFFALTPPPNQIVFSSARKFFGVPDGALLWGAGSGNEKSLRPNTNYICDHLILRSLGHVEQGRAGFRRNEELCGQGMFHASSLSKALLQAVDIDYVRERRLENYQYLNHKLSGINRLSFELLNPPASDTPFCYPLLARSPVDRKSLAEQGIFVPTFWQECLNRSSTGFEWEKDLARNLLPLPVDHRYNSRHMHYVATTVQQLLDE